MGPLVKEIQHCTGSCRVQDVMPAVACFCRLLSCRRPPVLLATGFDSFPKRLSCRIRMPLLEPFV
jgi:hypothetical protein